MKVIVTSDDDSEVALPTARALTGVGDVCVKIKGVEDATRNMERWIRNGEDATAKSIAKYLESPAPTTPKKNANTIDELVSIRELNRMYGLALSACNTDAIKEELDRSYKWLMRAIIHE